jgi:hypothetical protein
MPDTSTCSAGRPTPPGLKYQYCIFLQVSNRRTPCSPWTTVSLTRSGKPSKATYQHDPQTCTHWVATATACASGLLLPPESSTNSWLVRHRGGSRPRADYLRTVAALGSGPRSGQLALAVDRLPARRPQSRDRRRRASMWSHGDLNPDLLLANRRPPFVWVYTVLGTTSLSDMGSPSLGGATGTAAARAEALHHHVTRSSRSLTDDQIHA